MSKKYFIPVVITALVLFTGFSLVSTHFEANPFSHTRQFEISYSATLKDLPSEAHRLRVWIPLAGNRDGQKILTRKITTPGSHQITKDPLYGNEMIYFEMEGPFPDKLDFKVDYQARVAKEDFLKSNQEKDPDLYLRSSRLMKVTEEVTQRTQSATEKKQTLGEKARGIYDDVIGHMVYEKKTPGWGQGNTLRACLIGRGNCTDFHSLFISMAHAAEIPARFKIGLPVPNTSEGKIPGYHCWAEYYDDKKGWQPVDASEAWKHPKRKEAYFGNFDTNKFLISVGRDIDLVPKQSGDPVNIFFYPYVEVDGKPFRGIHTSFHFKDLKS